MNFLKLQNNLQAQGCIKSQILERILSLHLHLILKKLNQTYFGQTHKIVDHQRIAGNIGSRQWQDDVENKLNDGLSLHKTKLDKFFIIFTRIYDMEEHTIHNWVIPFFVLSRLVMIGIFFVHLLILIFILIIFLLIFLFIVFLII